MSETTKHTPGPWYADHRDNGTWYVHTAGYPNMVANMVSRKDGTTEANARLIAAVLDLLAAAEATIPFLEALSHPMALDLRVQLRTASAKAKGD